MPRPNLIPTEEQRQKVRQYAAVGTPHEHIARKIGIRSPKTLRKYYRKELDESALDANANVAGALYNNAMGGDTNAQKFWMGCRAGWKAWQPPTGAFTPPPFIVVREKKDDENKERENNDDENKQE
jgi:hypothetical protein